MVVFENNAVNPFSVAYLGIRNGETSQFAFFGDAGDKRYRSTKRSVFHKHDYYEIVCIVNGTLTQQLENSAVRYNAGDVCFMDRNTAHCEGYETDCDIVFLNIKQEFLESLFTAVPVLPGTDQYSRGIIREFILDNTAEKEEENKEYLDFLSLQDGRGGPVEELAVFPVLNGITTELTLQSAGYSFRIQALLLQLFEILQDESLYKVSHIRLTSGAEDVIMSRIARYIKNRNGRFSRGELSAALNYNEDYLNRICKRHSGMTLSQYGNYTSVRKAQELLKDTDMSISDIIMEVGFVNRTHFYSIFTKQTGVSPQQYRNAVSADGVDSVAASDMYV